MKLEGTCQVGRQLRDAYLMALSREDSVRKACRSGEITGQELVDAREELRHARSEYWAHVERPPMQERLMARTWDRGVLVGILLLGVAANAEDYFDLAGVWALDSARSDLGQCRKVETMMLRVEATAVRVTVVELANDEFGGHLRKREYNILRRTGNSIQLQAEQQHNQVSTPPQQWTLSSDGTELAVRRQCGQSVQWLVFHRSTAISE